MPASGEGRLLRSVWVEISRSVSLYFYVFPDEVQRPDWPLRIRYTQSATNAEAKDTQGNEETVQGDGDR